MNKNRLTRLLALSASTLAACALLSAAHAGQDKLSGAKARVEANPGSLASAKRATPKKTLDAYLAQKGFDASTADTLVQVSETTDKSGRRFARFEQKINGKRVHGAYAKAAFDADGNPLQVIERIAPAAKGAPAAAKLSDSEAFAIAVDAAFGAAAPIPGQTRKAGMKTEFAKGDFYYAAPSVERVVILSDNNALEEAFLVETWSDDDNLLYHTVVDGLGRVVSQELRTAQDSYNIFPDHPENSSQTVTAGPGAGNAQSPAGWLSGPQTTVDIAGNNVRAYLDRNNNNLPDAGGLPVADGNFLAVANLAADPTAAPNQDVAIQNLFYLNNVIHDRLYRHGFTEATGNFQEDNFGNGGAGSDSVNAEGQDGGGTNNANFATPGDGNNPRMQMYLWTTTAPRRDGDLDSDIVWHEYGHGLTWRMIGSMGSSISGAIGEGMSDTLSIIINDEDRTGEYSTNDPEGVRSIRYSLHTDTIADFNASRGVHRNGEIYAATTWNLWTRYKDAGYTSDDILDDIVGGMNFTPANPDYFDMRDGILAAAPPARQCLVWEAFATRGMGEGGQMLPTIVESFDVPAFCDASLSGLSSRSEKSKEYWRAIVTAQVDANGAPVEGVEVSIESALGDVDTCVTDADGQCSIVSGDIHKHIRELEFTATALNGNDAAEGVPTSIVAEAYKAVKANW